MQKNIIISGKVLHTESNIGIPDIQICLIDAKTKSNKASSLTDEKGVYNILLPRKENKENNSGGRLGNDVINEVKLVFKAPNDIGKNQDAQILGESEVFNALNRIARIDRIATENLIKANIRLPNLIYESKSLEEQFKISDNLKERYNNISRDRYVDRVEKLKGFRESLKKSISRSLESDSEYLSEGDDLEQKMEYVFKERIQNINDDPVSSSGVIILTSEQKESLEGYLSADGTQYEDIPADKINSILFSGNDGNIASYLLRNNPISNVCWQKTKEEKCGAEHLNDQTNSNSVDDATSNDDSVQPLTTDDIPQYLGNLIHFQSSPENNVQFGKAMTSQRPSQEDVQKSIDSFILEKGPADSVAYFDFKSLNIAFKHVWKEAIDQGVLEATEDLYDRLIDLTGQPFDPGLPTPTPQKMTKDGSQAVQATSLDLDQYPVVLKHFIITTEQWKNIPFLSQWDLVDIARRLNDDLTERKRLDLRQQGNRIIDFAKDGDYKSMHRLINDLNKRLKENYIFNTFAFDENGRRSVNFGIEATYRQRWEPLNYQAGELAKTITLTPKEERKISYKTVIKRKRYEKEAEKNSSSIREERNTTSRAEAEIVQKAMKKTDFNLSRDGYFNMSLSHSAQRDSQETKKNFREAVNKAAQEFKSERSMEITSEESFETEYTESSTISNPNDELAVTYLFYELQRRYRVSEEIHRLTPVIMVAEPVPEPHEIDEDWIIANDWVINRVILDDSFIPALRYLSTSLVGDEHTLYELKRNLEQQRMVVDELKLQTLGLKEQAENRYRALQNAINQRIGSEEQNQGENIIERTWEFFGGDDEGAEAAKAREEAAKDAHDYAVSQAREQESKLYREIATLNALTEAYTKKLSNHLNQKNQVERLKVHIKDNIIYYMQAIWQHEPPDQRFMRLYNLKVPHFASTGQTYNLDVSELNGIWTDPTDETTAHNFSSNAIIASELTYKRLVEIADVSDPIGYMGNYIIFPLTEQNALTEYMMTPYVDSAFGLHDPDELGNMNLRDFSKYICCLHDEMTEGQFEAVKPVLKQYYQTLLASPLRNGEDIIVPTDSLFIEALPGKHALLEDFKLMHRAIDVKKVQAEVREMEIDNIRQAARILNDELDSGIDKKVIIEGNPSRTIIGDNDYTT